MARATRTRQHRTHVNTNQLRIIGGQWRGRKLKFADGDGLRPTLDRVRETLFNWLQPVVTGARCLDLFCGSGALGLEALSRGAAELVMVDTNRKAIRSLEQNLELLQADNAQLVNLSALEYLRSGTRFTPADKFDIVFLDPPFQLGLLKPCCEMLESGGWLKQGSYIYLEAEKQLGKPVLPENWQLVKEKQAGQLAYFLAIRQA